jgi:pimeloyl-ACP methyl ester carboxylesterase
MALEQTYQFRPEKFADHQIPTLLLLGGDSPPLFQQAIQLLQAALPTSQTTILPGQQHIAMDTNPDLFVKAVGDFFWLDERVERPTLRQRHAKGERPSLGRSENAELPP